MKKNNRRNSLEALKVVDAKNAEVMDSRVESVEELREAMCEETINNMEEVEMKVVMCTECGVEVVGEEYTVNGETVCVDCLIEMQEEIELIEDEKVGIFDMEMNKEWLTMIAKRDKLNAGIRNAILSGKSELSTMKGNYISAKVLKGLIASYKNITGFDMSDKQIDSLKKLNATQAYYVGLTVNKALKGIRDTERNKRFANANA